MPAHARGQPAVTRKIGPRVPDVWPPDAPGGLAVTATGDQGASQWYARGAVAFRLGDYPRAYERYLALEPKARDAARIRERIKRLRAGGGLRAP